MGKGFCRLLAEARHVVLVGDASRLKSFCSALEKEGVVLQVRAFFTSGPVDSPFGAEVRYGQTEEALNYLFSYSADLVVTTMYSMGGSFPGRLSSACLDGGVALYSIPAYEGRLWKEARINYAGGDMALSPPPLAYDAWWNRLLRRVGDIVFSLFLLLTIYPVVYVVVAFYVKISGAGSVLVTVERTGFQGKTYRAWRFRTTHQREERVFAFGRVLEKSYVKGLPQLFNVLSGSMSFVGAPYDELRLGDWDSALIARFLLRHKVRPGMTSRSKAYGCRSDEEMRQAEMAYVRGWSVWSDAWILIRTLFGNR